MAQVYLIAAFASTHDAMKAETLMTRHEIPARLIPVPPEVSAGCGLALRAQIEDQAKVAAVLAEAGVTVDFYQLLRDGSKRTVERLEP